MEVVVLALISQPDWLDICRTSAVVCLVLLLGNRCAADGPVEARAAPPARTSQEPRKPPGQPPLKRLPPVDDTSDAGDESVVPASFFEPSIFTQQPTAAGAVAQPPDPPRLLLEEPGAAPSDHEINPLDHEEPDGEKTSSIFNIAHFQDEPESLIDDQSTLQRIEALERQAEAQGDGFPTFRLSGFFQVDQAFVNQSFNNHLIFGDVMGGTSFRRVRLQALGNLAESTRYDIEVDFVALGRPSLMDVWGEQANLPFFGAVRIGHFRQPTTMDALTSVRHLEFLERSAPFWSFDPFRRTGIMAYRIADDEMSTLAYSIYATGFTFFNGLSHVYGTLGDTRFATQIGDSGGVSFAIRGTRLLYYDEPTSGEYLLHIGGGYNYSQIGGEGTTGPSAKTYEARTIPEFFAGDLAAGGLTAAGTPVVLDTGRILSHGFSFYHTELAGNYGPAHFQTEFMGTSLNQFDGPTVYYYGTYLQCGYFLTGEHAGYSRQVGVMDYNVAPYDEFFSTKRGDRMCGWGAWEVAFRWSYVNLLNTDVNPANQLSDSPGPPPVPNPGRLNESTVAVNWWWNQYTRVQFNWIHSMINNTGRGPSTMNTFAARFQAEF